MAKTDVWFGYDGQPFKVGHRVELHPGTDLWAQGARYGEVTKFNPDGSITVKLDKRKRPFVTVPSRVRRVR